MYSGIGARYCAVSSGGITSYESIDEDRILFEGAADVDDEDRIPCGRADADDGCFSKDKDSTVCEGIADADDGCASIDEDRIDFEGAADADADADTDAGADAGADADHIPCEGNADDDTEVSGVIGYGDGRGLDEGCHDGYSKTWRIGR